MKKISEYELEKQEGKLVFLLDDKDQAILDALKADSRLSIQQLSRKTGIAVGTVHNRIKQMKQDGIIRRYTIDVDQSKLGRRMVAHILIKALPRSDHILLLDKILQHAFIEGGSAVTGEYDLVLRVRVRDMEELDHFVLKFLRTFDEIAQSETMIAFKNVEKI